MPLTFEALKGQRYRWCFGGIQILRMHWRSLMPGRATKRNRLTTGQRWAYLSGVLQWYGDLLGLAFLVFLLAGALDLAAGGGGLFRKLTLYLAAAVPVLFLLGLLRAVALLRRGTGASWRDAIGAFFIWQSTSLVVARASITAALTKATQPSGPLLAGRAALVGVAGLIGTVIAAAVLLGAPGSAPRQSPPLIPPAQQRPSPRTSHSTPATSPKPSPTSTPATSPSPAPSLGRVRDGRRP